MRDRQTCVGCGKQSPETETNYTLISAQFGWRLTRYKAADGSLVIEWRCPTCWRDYKRAKIGSASIMPPSSQPSLPQPMSSSSRPPRATPSNEPAARTPPPPGRSNRPR